MEFTDPQEFLVYYKLQEDDAITVNEQTFRKIVQNVCKQVWDESDVLSQINEAVSEFENEYGEMNVSGTYQLKRTDDGEYKVSAHSIDQYPLDPAMTNESEIGAMSKDTFDEYRHEIIKAQDEVANRVSKRIDEFVTVEE